MNGPPITVGDHRVRGRAVFPLAKSKVVRLFPSPEAAMAWAQSQLHERAKRQRRRA